MQAGTAVGTLRRIAVWILGMLTVLVAPIAALLLYFSCSPGTDLQDAPHLRSAGVILATLASIACVVAVVLASPPSKRRTSDLNR